MPKRRFLSAAQWITITHEEEQKYTAATESLGMLTSPLEPAVAAARHLHHLNMGRQ